MDATTDDQLLVTADEKGFVTIWDVSNYCHFGKETAPPEVNFVNFVLLFERDSDNRGGYV